MNKQLENLENIAGQGPVSYDELAEKNPDIIEGGKRIASEFAQKLDVSDGELETEDNIWGFEAFKKSVNGSDKETFLELIGEMKDYEGDREEIFNVAIEKAMELAGENPDEAIGFAHSFDSLRCAHIFLEKYAQKNDIDIRKLNSFFDEINPRAEDEKGGPAFIAQKTLIQKALKNYDENKTELTLDEIMEICSCCTYEVKKYPRVELETKMLEALSPHLCGMEINKYLEIQKKLPTNLLKYESLVSFVCENEEKLSLKDIITLLDTVQLEDFFKELRDGTLLSIIVMAGDKVDSSGAGDALKLKEHISRLSSKAQDSPGIIRILEKINKK